MYIFLILAVVSLLLYVLVKKGGVEDTRPRIPSLPMREYDDETREKIAILQASEEWLEQRWERAKAEKAAGELRTVPHWFFDDPTDAQMRRLADMGLRLENDPVTKGQASDLIGLFEPPEEDNERILSFFKVPVRAMSETKAREEVAKLLADPEKRSAWESRPATPMQKEFYRFFGLKVPRGLSHEHAIAFIVWHRSTLPESQKAQLEEWDLFEAVYEDYVGDRDIREDYGIKKPSVSLYREAWQALKADGKSISEIDDDPEIVVAKIAELGAERGT